jgi:hypothetical protein
MTTSYENDADSTQYRRTVRKSPLKHGFFWNLWRRLLVVLCTPFLLSEFFDSKTGSEYHVSFATKVRLLYQIASNRRRILTASHFLEHLTMATALLKVPRSVPGSVVECGTFKGGSAASLSLICELCDRKLEIFDSFEGLPAPSESDAEHKLVGKQTIHSYEQGAYRGTLAEVESNIAKHGYIAACKFNPGFFDQTLPAFASPCVLIFADVDLTASLGTCLRYLWPLLREGCAFFTHEAQQLEISALFFDQEWWRSNLGCAAPGLIGAGTGVGLLPDTGGFGSNLGYTIKSPALHHFAEDPQTGTFI